MAGCLDPGFQKNLFIWSIYGTSLSTLYIMHTTKCIPSLTRDKNWLNCTKVKLDSENQALVSVICLQGIWGVVARAITLRVKIQILDDHLSTWAPPGGQPDTGTWQTGDCDTIQKGLKSNALAEGGIRRLFAAHNGFRISSGKLDTKASFKLEHETSSWLSGKKSCLKGL